jgi:hypothetical protein
MAVSKRLRFEIFRRDSHTCRYCGATAPGTPLRVDHIVPVALGGTDHPSNLVTACEPCNSGKTSTHDGRVTGADDTGTRPRLTAELADELVALWADAYQVHKAGEPSLKSINEVRQAVRDAYRYGGTAEQLRRSAAYCGLIGETYVGLDGMQSRDLLATTAEAFGLWRKAWHRSSGHTAHPEMNTIGMFETSVEIAADHGASHPAILRAAAAAGWAQTPFLEQHSSEIAELVGDF